MADGALKAERDFTVETDVAIPEAEQLAKSNVQEAIEKLLALEKQTRQASDLPSTSRILVAVVTICKDAGDWPLLNEQVQLLSKKHGQLKQAITKMVQVVMDLLDSSPNEDVKLSTIETLRTVTEGKIFVEVERARITRILSDIKKSKGDIKAATEILCELQVETFGSMSRREKTEFILEQVSLCIENDDWVQAGILSRKISTRYFARKPKKTAEQLEKEKKEKEERERKRGPDEAPPEPEDDVTDLKLRYYEQQITLAKHDDKYLEACKHWRQVLDTEAVENNPEQLKTALQRVIYFVLLAPYDNEQSDLLHRIHRDTRNTQIPTDAEILKLFTLDELMRWPSVSENYGKHLTSSDVFSTTEDASDPKAHKRWQDFRKRVIEHNVRVIAKYYTRVHLARLTELLDLGDEETEKYISELVVNKTIYAKIDRPARVVSFEQKRDADEVLNEWSGNMKSLLGLLERIDHLITKEEMMARIAPVQGEKSKAIVSWKSGCATLCTGLCKLPSVAHNDHPSPSDPSPYPATLPPNLELPRSMTRHSREHIMSKPSNTRNIRVDGAAPSYLDWAQTALRISLTLPVRLVSFIVHRAIYGNEGVPVLQDLLLNVIRWGNSLPLSVRRLTLGSKDGQVLQSNHFKGRTANICQRVDTEHFTGYWMCTGPPGKHVKPSECDIVLLFLYGGAYVIGHPLANVIQFLFIAEELNRQGITASIFGLQYSRAPEHSFPTPIDETTAAYQYLLDQSINPSKIILAGESAGGHLALSALHELHSKNVPKPGGALLLFPWVDLTNSAPSMRTNSSKDMLQADMLNQAVSQVLRAEDRTRFAHLIDFSQPRPRGYWKEVLPARTSVCIGTFDSFIDSVRKFADNALADGARLELNAAEQKPHGYTLMRDIRDYGAYLKSDPADDNKGLMNDGRALARIIAGLIGKD